MRAQYLTIRETILAWTSIIFDKGNKKIGYSSDICAIFRWYLGDICAVFGWYLGDIWVKSGNIWGKNETFLGDFQTLCPKKRGKKLFSLMLLGQFQSKIEYLKKFILGN